MSISRRIVVMHITKNILKNEFKQRLSDCVVVVVSIFKINSFQLCSWFNFPFQCLKLSHSAWSIRKSQTRQRLTISLEKVIKQKKKECDLAISARLLASSAKLLSSVAPFLSYIGFWPVSKPCCVRVSVAHAAIRSSLPKFFLPVSAVWQELLLGHYVTVKY